MAFTQKLRALLVLSDLTIPRRGLVGGVLLTVVCNAAIFSLIWKVDGELRRLDPGEMSRRAVSSVIAESVLFLLLPFGIRRGCMAEGSFEVSRAGVLLVVDDTVPGRRRVLLLGRRFSASAIVQGRERYNRERGSL